MEATSNSRPTKRLKPVVVSTASNQAASRPPKKKTKKQHAEEAKQRRRDLATFDKVWGPGISIDADETTVQPPSASLPPSHETPEDDGTGDADAEGLATDANTDVECIASKASPDMISGGNADTDVSNMEGIAVVRNADEDAPVSSNANSDLPTQHGNADMDILSTPSADAHTNSSSPAVNTNPQDENYVPEDESHDVDDDHNVGEAEDNVSVEEKKGATTFTEGQSRRVLRDHGGPSPLRFDYADILDPNFVSPTGENSLDTDGEGADDSAEAATDESDDASSDVTDLCETDCLQRERSLVGGLVSNEDRNRLHKSIQGSSEVYNDNQLDEMKRTGWEVLPDNVAAEITDDSTVDKMYDSYCGPSRDVMPVSKSPLGRFLLLLAQNILEKGGSTDESILEPDPREANGESGREGRLGDPSTPT